MDRITPEDINRTQGLILTEKCGHQKTVLIPSQTLDNLHRKFGKCNTELKLQNRDKLTPQALTSSNVDDQLNRLKLGSHLAELNLLTEEDAMTKDSKDWEPTFEVIKAYLLTEVDSHQALLFAKRNQLSSLQDEIKTTKRNIIQEETLVKNSKSSVDAEKRRLTKRIDQLDRVTKKRSMSLVSLIDKFFPRLTEEEIVRETGQASRPKTMRRLINILCESLSDSRTDPERQWVTLDDSFWKPYVRTLILCEIAKYHPDGADRIAMINFGED